MDSVILNGHWTGRDKSVSTFKTPTHLLLNEKREFEAFGYEAERRYVELHQQGRHQRCFFFRRFRTKLAASQVMIDYRSRHLHVNNHNIICISFAPITYFNLR